MKKYMTIRLRDGSLWGYPTETIARHRANFYKDEFGGSLERSLAEDTIPLFEESEYEISDWAAGNMDVTDFLNGMVQLKAPETIPLTYLDHNNALSNGKKSFCDG